MADTGVEVWDFSLAEQPKRFKFDGDEVYEAPATLSPARLRHLAEMRAQLQGKDVLEQFDAVVKLFDHILFPESAAKLRKRLDDPEDPHPVDMTRQLIPVMHRLFEGYGLRPTKQSSPSATGGGETATPTSSTGGRPRKASTRKTSRRTAGST